MARPHGLGGEVVVDLSTNVLSRLDRGSVLEGPSGTLVVAASRPFGGRHLVRFEGISSRSEAEGLRGAVIRASRVQGDGVLWVHELVGAEVFDRSRNHLGRIVAVEANPASDLLVLEGGHLIPLRFVVEHVPGREVVVDVPDGLLE